MAYIPADNVCQAELIFSWNTQIVETVLHFEPDSGLTPTKMNELGAFLQQWYDTQMQNQHPTTVSLINIKLTDLTLQIGPVVNYSTGLPLVGAGASPSLPNNVALVFTKRTILRGRSYRGRIYHFGLMESMVTDNQVGGANITNLVAIYSLLLNPITATANWDLVVVSRYNNNQPRVTADVTAVTNITTDGLVDSQRRRLPGRGS